MENQAASEFLPPQYGWPGTESSRDQYRQQRERGRRKKEQRNAALSVHLCNQMQAIAVPPARRRARVAASCPTARAAPRPTRPQGIDVAIPANNKGKHSIGVLYYLLTRMVLMMRGTLSPSGPAWDVMVDMFFYREPGEPPRPCGKWMGGSARRLLACLLVERLALACPLTCSRQAGMRCRAGRAAVRRAAGVPDGRNCVIPVISRPPRTHRCCPAALLPQRRRRRLRRRPPPPPSTTPPLARRRRCPAPRPPLTSTGEAPFGRLGCRIEAQVQTAWHGHAPGPILHPARARSAREGCSAL